MGVAQRLAVAGLVGGLAITGLGVAAAQTGSETPPPAEPAPAVEEDAAETRPEPGRKAHFRGRRHFPGRGPAFGFGPGPGFGGAIHAEFTTPGPDGTFRTVATQTGEVTEVSPDEITVRSADGYSRTYPVDEDTFVGAGRDGIGDVNVGDDVTVMALVEDGVAQAKRVTDTTNLRRFAERWGHRKGGR